MSTSDIAGNLDPVMLELFAAEVDMHLPVLSEVLLAMEKGRSGKQEIESMMRAAHSIKGAARIVGNERAVRVAHVMEDCFTLAKEDRITLSSDAVDVLLQGVDALQRICTSQTDTDPSEEFIRSLLERIAAVRDGTLSSVSAVTPPAPVPAPTGDTTIVLPAQFDDAAAESLREQLCDILRVGGARVRLDFGQVEHLSVTAMSVLLSLARGRRHSAAVRGRGAPGCTSCSGVVSGGRAEKQARPERMIEGFVPGESSQSHQFVVEAREHLAGMTAALIAIERGEDDPRTHVEQLLRSAHSIKGGAGFIGLRKIEHLAHSIETAFENVRDERIAATPEAIDALLGALDRVGGMIDDLEHSEEADVADLLARLQPLIEPPPLTTTRVVRLQPRPQAVVAAPQPSDFPVSDDVRSGWQQGGAFLYGVKLDWFACERELNLGPLEVSRRLELAGTVLDSRFDLVGPSLRDGSPVPPLWFRAIVASELDAEPFARQLNISCAGIIRLNGASGRTARVTPASTSAPGPAEPKPRATAAATSLRISVPLIDRMMELAGELALVRNQAVRSTDPTNAPLRRLMRRLDSVTDELQDAALRMRMQPVSNLFDRFPRLVRDLGRQLGKDIEIEISGSQVELDKTVLEILADPLTHLIRNCCDHGIETPDRRTAAGKSPTGVIKLSARQDRGQIVIEVRDDGKGLDPEAIKRKAIEQGIKRPNELDALSERQLYDLILLSGFSTASKVTDLSGRGVGMDVVKTNLDQAGGFVEIDSAVGRGSVFTLRLPLTLAIMPCLLVTTGEDRYAIPQRDLEEIVLLEPNGRQQIECTQDEEVLRLRGTLVPVVRLSEVLSRRQPITASARAAIIARYHPLQEPPRRQYVAILRIGSHVFGLLVDDVLESEDVVVKPLHPLLRQLGVFGAATILPDGGVALILSGDGLARHSGILHRPIAQALPPPETQTAAGHQQPVLLFRYGAAELLAMPLAGTQRVVNIRPRDIEHVGDRELVNVNGTAVNVLRLDRILNLSSCPDQDRLFLILPRTSKSVGLLASEIVDTPTLPVQLDAQAYKVDGILGTAMIRGQIAVFIDTARVLEIWRRIQGASARSLPDGSRRRILIVEDTQFFQKLITSHLEEEGYVVTLAENGQQGLEKLATEQFDLIVSDIEMPVMDGFAFARHVREQPRFAAIPLLALTTLNTAENRNKAAECGFDAYEVKLDRATLLTAVARLLNGDRSTAITPGRTAR